MAQKILLIATRWNSASFGVDGGSMTAIDIMESLAGCARIDILTSENLKSIIPSQYFEHIHTFRLQHYDGSIDKFCLRKNIALLVAQRVKDLIDLYDKIIVVHTFNALFFHELLSEQDFSKIILFPMFLSPSYEKSNEKVPEWYKKSERLILSDIKNIITPSEFEKKQLLDVFQVNENYINVIPRMVSSHFMPVKHSSVNEHIVLLSCTSSFRRQKRLELSIEFIKCLKSHGINAKLYMVGSIQDKNEYEKYLNELNKSGMSEIYHIDYMSQTELNILYSTVDFNISFSSCETFGRAIVESLYTGLPNVILDESGDLSSVIGDGHGAVFCRSIQDMVSAIELLSMDSTLYSEMGQQAIKFGSKYNCVLIKTILANAILKYDTYDEN